MATVSQIRDIIKLYVGYYNRAPDPEGLKFWISRFDAGVTIPEMAVRFSDQVETRANYPFFTKAEPTAADYGTFIDAVYQNLFNRAPDTEGRDFWIGKLTSGQLSVGQSVYRIIQGAVGGTDKQIIDNKVSVGLDFYNKTSGIENFSFDKAFATSLQGNVTADTSSVTAAAAATDAHIGSSTGKTINLTTNADQPGGGNGAVDTQGGDGFDTYSATFSSTAGTLQSSDNIAAAGGDDVFNIRVTSNGSVAPQASDLEKIVITNNTSSGTFVLDMVAMSGETEVWFKDASANVVTRASNVDMGTIIGLTNVAGSSVSTAHFKGESDRSGTSDAFTLKVEGSGSSSSSAVFGVVNASASQFDTSFEAANLETVGTKGSFLNLQGSSLTSVNITGTSDLNLENTTNAFAGLKMVDASGLSGGLNMVATGTTETDFSFTGSSQNDRIFVSNSLINNGTNVTMDAGGGTDILAVSSFTNLSSSNVNKYSSFETLEANSAVSSVTASDFSSIHNFKFDGQTSNSNRINIRGVETNDRFIFTTDHGRGDEAIRFTAQTAGQSVTMELEAQSGTGGEVRILSDTNSGNDSAAIGFQNNFGSVQIVSNGSNENANVIRSVDNGSNNYFAFDNQNGPNNFSITGSQDLTITAEKGVQLDASSDELGFQSGVTVDADNFTGVLRIAGSNSADTILGGSNADIIYGMGGDNTLTGNGGADQFRFSTYNNNTDRITDFSGNDIIAFSRVDFGNTAASQDGAILSASDYIENISNIGSLSSGENNTVVEMQSALSANQITNGTSSTTDMYMVVFNSTSGKGEIWYDSDWSSTSGRSMTAELSNIVDLSGITGLSNSNFAEYTF